MRGDIPYGLRLIACGISCGVTVAVIAVSAACGSTAWGMGVSQERLARDNASSQPLQPGAAARSQRDSIYTLRVARNHLRTHHFQFEELVESMDGRLMTPYHYEKNTPPFFYGPLNGRIPFGAEAFARAVELRTSELSVPKDLHRRVSGMVSRLSGLLDDAQRKLPGDRWLVGQRVLQRVMRGDFEQAQRVARDCTSDPWWCAALVGYTSHLLSQFSRADSATTFALESMPEQERCQWESVADLVWEDADRPAYVGLWCSAAPEFHRVFWWLTDPLYLTPGNERRSAHYYREVFRALYQAYMEALPPTARVVTDGSYWHAPSVPSLMRAVGPPAFDIMDCDEIDRCGERPTGTRRIEGRGVLLQYPQPTYHFVPRLAAVFSPMTARVDDWDITDSRATERYHPPHGVFTALDFQLAWFRRGSQARVVAAADLAGNAMLSRSGPQITASALVLSRNPDDIRLYREAVPGTNVTWSVLAPAESSLVSMEAMTAGVGAGRARLASGPPLMPAQRVTLSDILLYRPDNGQPGSLEDAVRRALPATRLAVGDTVGLFWEVYGLAAGDTVTYSVTAHAQGGGVLTGVARLLGLRGGQSTGLQWTEYSQASAEITARVLEIDVGALSSGEFDFEVAVVVEGQDTVRVRRGISILRR